MTSWLRRISPKPDHPMRDLKAAQRLLTDLPQGDPYKSLQEITAWVESVTHASGYKLNVRASILLLLDDAGFGFQRKLQREYLTQTRTAKFRERAIWRALCDYWKALVGAYLFILDAYAMGARGADAAKPQVAMLASRGLHAVSMLHKAMQLHYGPVEDLVWGGLSRLWLFVEAQGLQATSVSLYEHSEKPTCAQAEFLKTLFLAASSPDSLLPQQIDLAERTIDDVAEYLVVGAEPDSRSAFYFDLSAQQPPGRLVMGMALNPRMRFIGPSMASVRLQELARALDNPSAISASGSGVGAPVSSLRQVLQHLLFYWSLTPPERKWPRLPAYGRLTVVHGFADVARAVMFARLNPSAGGADARDHMERQKRDIDTYGFVTDETQRLMHEAAPPISDIEQRAESWLVQDISLGGFGAVLPQLHGDWLRIGALTGIKTDRLADWQVGVVRRLQYDMERQIHIGVEVVAACVTPVRIELDRPDPERQLGEEYALLVGTSIAGAETCSVLMRGGIYLIGRQYRLAERDQVYLLEPISLREQGDGFEIIEFNVLCQLSGPEY